MISEAPKTDEAYVWIWLPGETNPVVAGRLSRAGSQFVFNYGKSYLQRENAISIYEPELPLREGTIDPFAELKMPNCIRDASPDAWGRRVIINKMLGQKGTGVDTDQLDELTYLLQSGSDRVGALDFQHSATEYSPRQTQIATLDELLNSAERVEAGVPLTPELDQALQHGSSLGGARPKALITDNSRKYIAKFSASNDLYNVVKLEFVAMRLAAEVGLNVAPTKLVRALEKDVLLVERFDRVHDNGEWQRGALVSALTLLELDEMHARYASYQDLADTIRHRFVEPVNDLHELFARLVFNILCGNTDDHARNHAAFWNGRDLTLTPAYDICPQGRTGYEASQAMLISGNDRRSRISVCVDAAPIFLMDPSDAAREAERQTAIVNAKWDDVCDEASLSKIDRALFWERQFLNPYAFLQD